MCSVRMDGNTVEVKWVDPISDIAPVTFAYDERTGWAAGRAVSTTILGTIADRLISEWRAQIENGDISVPSTRIIRFQYPSADEAERHILTLADMILRHTGVVAQAA